MALSPKGTGLGEEEKARQPASGRQEEKNLRSIQPENPGGSGGKALPEQVIQESKAQGAMSFTT